MYFRRDFWKGLPTLPSLTAISGEKKKKKHGRSIHTSHPLSLMFCWDLTDGNTAVVCKWLPNGAARLSRARRGVIQLLEDRCFSPSLCLLSSSHSLTLLWCSHTRQVEGAGARAPPSSPREESSQLLHFAEDEILMHSGKMTLLRTWYSLHLQHSAQSVIFPMIHCHHRT